MRISLFHRSAALLDSVRVRLRLSVAAVVALATGLASLCVAVVGVGGVTEDVTQHNGLARSDLLHLRWFTHQRSDALISISRLLSDIGSVVALGAVAVLAGFLLWRRGLPFLVALVPTLSLGIAGTCAAISKTLVARSRPPVSLHLVSETNLSLPSGHATDATALYVTLALVVAIYVLRNPLARVACVLASGVLAAGVGVSRLVLGVHWPTDILAGWALGASVALAVTITASLAVRATPQEPGPEHPLRARLTRLLTSERRGAALRSA